jgi:hypothetical protein
MDAVTRGELQLVINMVNENTNRGVDAINNRLDVSNGRLGKVEAANANHDARLAAVEQTVAALREKRSPSLLKSWHLILVVAVALVAGGMALANSALGEFLLKLALHT